MDNISYEEVDKFSLLSHQWWESNGPFKALHDINPVRLDYIHQRGKIKNKTVLDIGCGGGLLTEAMCKKGANVSGIDASEENILIARQHAQDARLAIHYLNSSAENLAKTHAQQFDVITCMELLEHVPDPASLIRACSTLVKPGGRVFFSTINRNIRTYLSVIVMAEHILGLLPKGTHSYSQFIRPSELAAWCRQSDLQVEDISGMHYLPYIRQSYLTPIPAINYLVDAKHYHA